MEVVTCYTVPIKKQLKLFRDGFTECCVDDKLMRSSSKCCLDALQYCVDCFLAEWDEISKHPATPKPGVPGRRRICDLMIHSTADNQAKYPEFDRMFACMPAYTRRAIIADALGLVSSYQSNHKNWEAAVSSERGNEPTLGLPDRYELTFYKQDRQLCDLDKGVIGLKLYDGKTWGWYYFRIGVSDAKYIQAMQASREMLSPVVEKVRGRYQIRFSFREKRELISNEDPLSYRILAVDLGINAPASWCVMESDGTVRARGVIRLLREEGRLNHMINRKRMFQQAGKKSRSIYRMVTEANRALSIETSKRIVNLAILYDVDCIVFEHLDRKGKIKGKRYKERIHMWRANDVQARVELQAHRNGMRISRVCAWGTSKYAFDGSGEVKRGADAGLRSYSICRFPNGKIYNCDLSAAFNIGARYYLRILQQKHNVTDLPKTPFRTYAVLYNLVHAA